MDNEMEEIVADFQFAGSSDFKKKEIDTYNRLMADLESALQTTSNAFVSIACNLWEIHHNEYYRIDSYKTIAEFALDKYEMKKSATHNYIRVIERFGKIVLGKAKGLKTDYEAFSCSQLVHMLTFTPEQLKQVKPEWTVRQIDEFGRSSCLLETPSDSQTAAEADADDTDFSVDASAAEPELIVPNIEAGRIFLSDYEDFEELIQNRCFIEKVLFDMRNDVNFKYKKVRLVVELAYD